jgi:4-hydroxybenzoate polyprenyltransferase
MVGYKGVLRAWVDLLRLHEYLPLSIFSVLAGALLATKHVDLRLIPVLLFVALSSMSAFVLNDIMDVEEDKARGDWRNPIASGRLGKGAVLLAFAVLALLSLIPLPFMELRVTAIGITALLLLWIYSWGPRLKDRPILDLMTHGAGPALYALMGYALYGSLNIAPLLLAVIVFMLSCTSCILQQIRDMDAATRAARRTTSLIGMKRSVDLAMVLMLISIMIYVLMVSIGVLPPIFAIVIPYGVILMDPLSKLKIGILKPEEVIKALRLRGSLLAAIMLLLYLIS